MMGHASEWGTVGGDTREGGLLAEWGLRLMRWNRVTWVTGGGATLAGEEEGSQGSGRAAQEMLWAREMGLGTVGNNWSS